MMLWIIQDFRIYSFSSFGALLKNSLLFNIYKETRQIIVGIIYSTEGLKQITPSLHQAHKNGPEEIFLLMYNELKMKYRHSQFYPRARQPHSPGSPLLEMDVDEDGCSNSLSQIMTQPFQNLSPCSQQRWEFLDQE